MTPLFIIFVLLQAADALLTERIIARGGHEMNPIMAPIIEALGQGWVFVKLLVTASIAGIMLANEWASALAVSCGVMVLVVLWNWKEYRKTK